MNKGAIIKRKQIRNLLLFIIALVVVNIFFSGITYRIDLTQDRRFTLTAPTRKLLKELKGPVKVKVYLRGDHLPAGFRHFAAAIKGLLEDFRRYSGGRLQYEFINPLAGIPDSAKAKVLDSLAAMGIRPYNVQAQQNASEGLSLQLLFPAALMDYNGHKLGINLLQPQPGSSPEQSLNHSTALLEYNFAHAITLLAQEKPPQIAYLLGNGEALDPSVYDALTLMDQNYRFDTLNLKAARSIPLSFEAIVLLDPSIPFTKEEKLKLDQYLMQGGKILWVLHSVQASMDSLQQQTSFLAFDKGLNLDNLLFTYGLRINSNILQDLQCFSIPVTVGHIGNKPQIQRLPWIYEPLLTPATGNPVTNNLDLVLSAFPGSIDTIKSPGIKKSILLATSAHSRSIATPSRISLEDVKIKPRPEAFKERHLAVAVLLEGRFPSAFKNRLNATEQMKIKLNSGKSFRAESKTTKMIAVSDPNILKNKVSKKDGPLPMGMDPYTRQLFANRQFFENCLTYLTDTTGIMQARDKDFSLRLLDKAKVEEQKDTWTVLNFLIPSLLVLFFGMIFQYVRKRKYTA